jgi:hypothetical protein
VVGVALLLALGVGASAVTALAGNAAGTAAVLLVLTLALALHERRRDGARGTVAFPRRVLRNAALVAAASLVVCVGALAASSALDIHAGRAIAGVAFLVSCAAAVVAAAATWLTDP